MAVALDVDNLCSGYFTSTSFEEISFYVVSVIRKPPVASYIFQVHASAQFERDDVVQEIHLPTIPSVVLDPQLPDELLYDILAEKYYYSTETEFIENMDGSGWKFQPGTFQFWFKLYPCQPNDPADPNRNNQTDDPDDNPPEEIRYINWFAFAVIEFFARHAKRSVPRVKLLRIEMLKNFKNEFGINIPDEDLSLKIQMQDVARYHELLNACNIRIFSLRGNLLYAKALSPEGDVPWIDMYLNSGGQFALIIDLWSFFKKRRRNSFCMKCLKWVPTQTHTCEQKKLVAKKEEVPVPSIPLGRHGLVVYADFESYIRDERHTLSGYGWVSVDKFHKDRDTNLNNLNSSENLVDDFLKDMIRISKEFAEDDGHETPMCQICEQDIFPEEPTIIGRNFINGRQGSHHPECWKLRQNSMYIFFHNFRGYDSHFIISKIVARLPVLGLSATSMEKFNLIHCSTPNNDLVQFTFKDTYNFMSASLAKLVDQIENWVYSPEEIRNHKGLFPYDWFDSPEKLNATELPPSPWFNKLTRKTVDATEAFALWARRGMTTFEEFHNYYMMADVLQLADAFEEFRRTCVDEFDVDPVHFQGAPGLTWYLGLCQNPKLFRVIRNVDIYMDIQNSIRGGVSQAMTRYCNIENKPEESMFFLDVNSLYSKCMTYKLPGKYIETITELPENWPDLFNQNTPHTALLVVDLIYPPHLHDRDWAYPLAPHSFNDRLCTTFKNREKYMVHAEALIFYLQRGLILEKFHYGYVFEHDYALRDYVQYNIEKRRHTKSEVMKTLYKLLNNSIYGKTCENVNKYRKFDVIKNEEDMFGHVDEWFIPINGELDNCKSFLQCGDRYLVEKVLPEVTLNKPIQIGFAILEFAKLEIYRFIAIIQDHFGDKVVPLYTDTDSLLFWCAFPEPWKYFYNSPLQPLLDFEKAPQHWNLKTKDTDKQSGLWSPEAGGKEIIEYVGLRAKCYCYRFRDDEIVIKNKGIPKAAMIANDDQTPREQITIQHYRDALFKGELYHITNYTIRSLRHEVITKAEYKLGLSANDLKRFVTANRAISLPFGYKGQIFDYLAADQDTDNLDP
uniref:DNA-directed DNA polymerase n=1 Tax=Phoenicurus auroreus parvoviridae sp. TaxID=2794531 RepID=A0A8E7G1V4_9VIRU|nr:MAG: structural protein [Phoenicurus auroreus parvoviridae sp.]